MTRTCNFSVCGCVSVQRRGIVPVRPAGPTVGLTLEMTNIFLSLSSSPSPLLSRSIVVGLTTIPDSISSARPSYPSPQRRCDDHVEFFHHVQRFPKYTSGRVQFDGDERVGRSLHVLHLRVPPRVRLRQLRGSQAAAAQRRLPPGREPSDSGNPA